MAKEKLKVKEELLEPSVNIDAHISEEDYNKIKKELYRFADPNYLDHSSDKNKVLKVRNLSVGFLTHGKKINVIRNISLDVIKGETLAIVGESGSGKSVFTKTFTGMLEDNGFISSGEILFRNPKTNEFDDISKYKSNKDWQKIRGRRIATIFQDPMTSLNPLLTIGFQIAEVLQIHHGFNKKDAKEEAIKILERVQIPDARNRYNDYPYQHQIGRAHV